MKCLLNAYGEFNDVRRIGPTTWGHFDLFFLHGGHVSMEFAHKTQIELLAGQSVLIYPQTHFEGRSLCEVSRASAHHFKFAAGSEPDALSRRLMGKRNGWQVFTARLPTNIESDIDRLIKIAEQGPDPLLAQSRSLLMSLVLAQILYAQSSRATIDPRWADLLQWLGENLREPPPLETMARRMGLSVSHFQAVFRRQFHASPGRYLLEMRLDEAARLLRESIMPSKQIGRRVGYAHVQHFHRAFRARHGQTPGEYRGKYSADM